MTRSHGHAQPIHNLLGPALAEMRAIQTPESPTNTGWIDFEFETFGEQKLKDMETAAIAFSRAAEVKGAVKGHWLTILGRSGIGKTHIASRVAGRIIKAREGERIITPHRWTFFKVRRIKWRNFVDAIMGRQWGIVDALIEPHFLYVDEIGDEATGTREIVFSKFGNVCDARLGKWTLFTGNQSLSNIAAIDARVASRMLRQGNVVIDAGDKVQDYALRKLHNR